MMMNGINKDDGCNNDGRSIAVLATTAASTTTVSEMHRQRARTTTSGSSSCCRLTQEFGASAVFPNLQQPIHPTAATDDDENNQPKTATTSNSIKNLFVECVHFWAASLVAPTTTNLRTMARKGLLQSETNDADLVLTLPVSVQTIMDVFQRNQERMLQEFANDPGIPFHIDAVAWYQEQVPHAMSEHAHVVVFDDVNADNELVYGIIVDTYAQSTYLIFRGSVSKRDYEADFDFQLRTLWFGGDNDNDNDVRNEDVDNTTDDNDNDQTHREERTNNNKRTQKKNSKKKKQRVRAQKGFSDYLFGTQEETAVKSRDGLPHTKFEKIQQSLLEQYTWHPDHELCITGHSLGGSLALLAATALAMDDQIVTAILLNKQQQQQRPIRVLGFGSLLVGDLTLLRCFQRLERENLIRSTVIMNQGDLIPLLPFSSGWRFYRALGKRIILSEGGRRKPIIYSPPEALPLCGCYQDAISVPGFIVPRFFFVLCCRRNFWKNHTVDTTTRNIFESREHLEALSIETLYERRKRLLPWTIRGAWN